MQSVSCNALNFGSPNNNYKFNGGDEWEESLNLYSTFFRGYDQQIGRFRGVDMMSEKTAGLSTYQFSFNNPVSFNDPLGNAAGSLTQEDIERMWSSANGGHWDADNGARTFDSQEDALRTTLFDNFGVDLMGSWWQGGDGGAGGHGGGSSINPLQKFLNSLNSLIKKGFNITGFHSGFNKDGVFGIDIGYTGCDENAAPDGFVKGDDFVKLPELGIQPMGGSEMANINSGWHMARINGFLDAATTTFDILQHGLIGAQKLANTFGKVSYEIADIGKYRILRLGNFGNLTLEGLGNIAGGIITGISIIDAFNNPNADNITDSFIGIVSLTTPAGWIISTAYFFSNELIKSITGKSIGEWSEKLGIQYATHPSNWAPILGPRF